MRELINNLKNYIIENGKYNSSHKTYEVMNHSFVVFLSDIKEEDLDLDHITYATKKVDDYVDGIDLLVKRLCQDYQSRQAVVSFEIESDLPNCMLSVQVQVRGTKIYCTVYQRSLDIVKKLPQDVLIAKLICDKVAHKLSVVSNYQIQFFVGNSHVYTN